MKNGTNSIPKELYNSIQNHVNKYSLYTNIILTEAERVRSGLSLNTQNPTAAPLVFGICMYLYSMNANVIEALIPFYFIFIDVYSYITQDSST